MKTLIIALNSKYIHSALAPRYLKASCGNECGDIDILELTINDSLDSILASIYREKADSVAFSCYIWNIAYVLKLAEDLKKVSPATKIILGGPEVSFDAVKVMEGSLFIDYIISGEGENVFKLLLKHLFDGSVKIGDICGLTYRNEGAVLSGEPCPLIENLDSIPSPYSDEMLASLGGRIVYFESSRGCPFSCSYCISSTFEGVRYFSMDRVKRDLLKLIEAGVKQVKFVDRTFNANRERAKEIIKFVIENAAEINFHFEAAGDLFDDEMLQILSTAPEGLIQFEIGIQTTNEKTLEMINRRTSIDKVFNNVRRLNAPENINIHLDLIAGLPGEDYDSFKESFNDVYLLKPHQLQLGFLKMLKGSKIRREIGLHGYEFRDYAPYEVLCNKYMSFDEMLELKGIEEIVERYYNSGRFANSLEFIINNFYGSAFEFYYEFLQFNKRMRYLERPLSSRELYAVLMKFLKEWAPESKLGLLKDLLKLDFLSCDSSNNLPEGIDRSLQPGFKERCFDFLKSETNICTYLKGFAGVPAKEIFKRVHFEIFNYDVAQQVVSQNIVIQKNNCIDFKEAETVVLFNYSLRNKVTGLFNYEKLATDIF